MSNNLKKRFQNRNQIAIALETKNKIEQLEKIQQLKQAATMPVIDIITRLDTRTGDYGFSIIGAKLSIEETIDILEKGLDELRMMYIEQKNAQAQAEADADPDKMKASSGHKSGDIVLTQHESEENKKNREEAEEETADENPVTEVPDGESTRT